MMMERNTDAVADKTGEEFGYTTNMKIQVTQQHIDRGELSDGVIPGFEYLGRRRIGTPKGCPIAIAINEQIPTCEAIVVGGNIGAALTSLLNGYWAPIKLPESARLFVSAFDAFHQCGHKAPQLKPFSFDLDVPEQFLPKEPKRHQSPTCERSPAESVFQEK